MNLSLTVNGWLDEELIFAQQLGVNHIFVPIDLGTLVSPSWDPKSLAGLHNRIEKTGLTLAGICATFPLEHPGLGSSLQNKEAIEPICRLIEAAGAAEIGLVDLPPQRFTHQSFWSGIANRATSDPSQKKLSLSLMRLAETSALARVRLAIPVVRPVAFPHRSGNQIDDNLDIRV